MLLDRRFLLGTAVTVGLLFLFLWKIDFSDTWSQLLHANYAYFLPAVALYFVALGFRSLRWRLLLLHIKPIPVRNLYPVTVIGYFANNVLPIRLGELVRSQALWQKEGVSRASGLATIGVERVMDGLTLIFFVVVVWPFLPWTEALKADDGGLKVVWLVASGVVAALFATGFIVLFVLAARPELGRRMAGFVVRPLPERFRGVGINLIMALMEGLGALKSPRRLGVIALVSLPVWLTEAAMYYIIALSFDLDQSFGVILLVTATANLATAVPSSVGGIGPFEVVAKSTLVAFGVAAEPAAAYSFFVHIVALWLPVNLAGLFFMWKENIGFNNLSRIRITGAQSESGALSPLHQSSDEQGREAGGGR